MILPGVGSIPIIRPKNAMYFYTYIKELKLRLIYVLICCISTFTCLYTYSDILLELLINNILYIKNNSLIFTTITESFFSHIEFSINFSVIITFLILFIQLWLFFKPSLYEYENLLVKTFGALFVLGFFFSNYIVLFYLLPIFFKFFLGFENINYTTDIFYIVYQGRISEYLIFIYNVLFNVGLLCQLPLLMFGLYLAGIINSLFLVKYRKFILFILLIIIGFISPPDIFSQLFIFIVLFLFYEFFVLLFLIIGSYK